MGECGAADMERSASQLQSLSICLAKDLRELRRIKQAGDITPSGARLPRVDAEIEALTGASRTIEQAAQALEGLRERYQAFEAFEAGQQQQ
jgi:hypothetical protein